MLFKKSTKKTEVLETEKTETIKKIDELKQVVVKNHIILKDKTKVYVADLTYIKSDDHYLKVYLSSGKSHFVRGKLLKIIKELPPNFIRCHRSYVVNRNFIKQINNTNIVLVDQTELPLSRTYKDKF
jgi:DNA-binding LytR/AlgR family response regulator